MITNDERKEIRKRAETKKNGVFSFKGRYLYGVVDKQTAFLGDRVSGEVYQFSYGFCVSIGKINSYEMSKKMSSLVKEAS